MSAVLQICRIFKYAEGYEYVFFIVDHAVKMSWVSI